MPQSTPATSLKWISNKESTSKGNLVVHDVRKVFDSISSVDSDPQCNLISIFGRARQGKSFLMNCLAGKGDIFKVSNANESCTQGIDISDLWLPLKDFSRIDGGTAINGNIKIGFVDAEGQGDKDVSYDATLICPILLASKCVIFNWKGELQKDNMLSVLGVMTQAAKNVKEEVSGVRISKKFGHLHIVIRDWQLDEKDKSPYELIFDTEEGESALIRNQIRQDLLESFESVHVWLFDAPMNRVSQLQQVLQFKNTTPKFKRQVRELRNVLSTQLVKPTVFGDTILTAKLFSPFIEEVARALNTSGAVMPSSAFLTMLRAEMDKYRESQEEEIKESVQRVLTEIEDTVQSEGSPYPSENEAMKLLSVELDKIQQYYEDEIQQHFVTLRGTLAEQVTADYPKQIQTIRQNYEHHFLTAFKNHFSDWLLISRKNAEAMLEEEVEGLKGSLPLSEAQLLEVMNNLLVKAVDLLGGYKHEGNPIVKDSIELLRRHHKTLTIELQKLNEEQLHLLKQQTENFLDGIIAKMKDFIIDALARFIDEQPMGYKSEKLRDLLNREYISSIQTIKEQISDPHIQESALDIFENSCIVFKLAMEHEYYTRRNSAFDNTLASISINISNHVKSVLQGEAEVASASLERYLLSLGSELPSEIVGWNEETVVVEDVEYPSFNTSLQRLIESVLSPFKIVDSAAEDLHEALTNDFHSSWNEFYESIARSHFNRVLQTAVEKLTSILSTPYNFSDGTKFFQFLSKRLEQILAAFLHNSKNSTEEIEKEVDESDSSTKDVDHFPERTAFSTESLGKAIEEARREEAKRLHEAVERTKARAHEKSRKHRNIFEEKSVEQQRADALKHAKMLYGEDFLTESEQLSDLENGEEADEEKADVDCATEDFSPNGYQNSKQENDSTQLLSEDESDLPHIQPSPCKKPERASSTNLPSGRSFQLPVPSEEQKSIIDCVLGDPDACIQVNSVAGSGKTSVILHIAKELQLRGKKSLMITYSARLKEETREKARALGLKYLEVHSYHSLFVEYYNRECYTDEKLEEVVRNGKAIKNFSYFSAVFVDEAQDMTPLLFRTVGKALSDQFATNRKRTQLVVIGDEMQCIFSFSGADSKFLTEAQARFGAQLGDYIAPKWESRKLTVSFRMSANIARFINEVLVGEKRITSLKQSGEPVAYYYGSNKSADAFRQQAVEIVAADIVAGIKRGSFSPKDVFVLVPSLKSVKLHLETFKRVLQTNSVPLVFLSGSDSNEKAAEKKAAESSVVFSTFHKSKGLERKIVVVMFVIGSGLCFALPVYYVAATRAQQKLIIIGEESTGRHIRSLNRLQLDEISKEENSPVRIHFQN